LNEDRLLIILLLVKSPISPIISVLSSGSFTSTYFAVCPAIFFFAYFEEIKQNLSFSITQTKLFIKAPLRCGMTRDEAVMNFFICRTCKR
jgi:hypothetical protein